VSDGIPPIIEHSQSGYTISTDPSRLDLDTICVFLGDAYWSQGRSRATIARSLQHSLCFGVYDTHGQVGLARVITDYATFAYLCDVYIQPEHRGAGLGKWLMATVMAHPSFVGLRLFLLVTRDAHGLYQQVGFSALQSPERWMVVVQDSR
jgi:GNAT superfamily N-acetyltransferase